MVLMDRSLKATLELLTTLLKDGLANLDAGQAATPIS
jgi:hypothetical protein